MALGGAAIILASAAAGLLLDSRSFLVNLTVAAISIVASAAVALSFVDWYVQGQRRQQWANVRAITFRAIVSHLCDLTQEMFIYFPMKDHRPMARIAEGRASPSAAAAAAMGQLAENLAALPSSVSREKSTSDMAVEYFEAVKWDLDQIRDVLTPRVLQFSTDQAPTDALIEFDATDRELRNAIIAHQQVVTDSVMPHIVELVREAKALYEVISKHWDHGQSTEN